MVPCHWVNGDLCSETVWWSHFESSESLIRHWLSDHWRWDHHAVSNLRSRLTQCPGATEPSRFLLLCPLAKFRKATINFVMTVRLSVLPSVRIEQLGSHWTDRHEIWNLNMCWKYIEKIHLPLQKDKKNGYFPCKPTHIYDNLLDYFFLEWEIFQTKFAEKLKTHNLR